MLRKSVAFCLLFVLISITANAQFYPTQYRPPHQQWQSLQTTHFQVVYAKGNDSTAYRMGRILEEHYGSVQQLVGGKLKKFPVVLNDYNDRSNGFVTSLHFRSEIELPPIKGKSQNPQTGNWLENVGPHELVHAMQISNLGDYNIPQLVSIFSPDLARSFHAAIPFGMLEGIAVQHETKNVSPDGGRGNYPLFTNQFNATFNSSQRWSMGQLFQTSSYTRPFSRHYIGGYEFTAWLHKQFGSQSTKEALDFYMDFPFLGYGVALHHSTGEWPNELYNMFEKAQKDSLNSISSSVDRHNALPIPFDGRSVHRPKWLSDSKLMFYGSFYNARSGFYTYDLQTDDLERILTTNSVRDYHYDLSPDKSTMVYSYYEANSIYNNTEKMELVEYDFSKDESTQLTKNGRTYAPAYLADSLLALQTQPASSKLVSVDQSETGPAKINQQLTLGEHQIVAVAPNPETNKLAVIVNKRGMQGLWIVNPKKMEQQLQQEPAVAFDGGSIFDPAWHPSGQKLMFSSDYSGTQQLYEYDLVTQSVSQITNSTFNAFEGSYSPDGTRIAYIKQVTNEQMPAVMKLSQANRTPVAAQKWQPNKSKINFMSRPAVSDSIVTSSKDWTSSNYSSGLGWLKPRTILPMFEEVSNRNVYQWGVGLHSNNLLANQTYSAEFSYLEDRFWYDLIYQNKSFFPGFKTRLYNQPSYRYLRTGQTVLRQDRSLALSIPTRIQLNQNIFSTSLFIEPEIRRSQIGFSEIGPGANTSDFAGITAGNLFLQFNYRIQQNIRDLQPNSGLVMYSELEHYLDAGDLNFTAYGNQYMLDNQRATGLRGGIFGFVSPFRQWNQSLRLGVSGITQSGLLLDNQSLVSDAFDGPVFPGANNLLSFNTRYTIPLTYVDNGGLLLPFYLSNIYLVAFSDTVTDPTFDNWYRQSRSVFGLGIRAKFRISNLGFDIGIGVGYEPSRNSTQFFVGEF